jgi:uncharacterized protein
MYQPIEKLLTLQDRDRKILHLREQLSRIEPERESLRSQTAAALSALDGAKTLSKQIESERKQRELDVEAKKGQIGKYSVQQFQTKKNEEYRALAHEIETCKADISKLEDQQLELMEKADGTAKQVAAANRESAELKKHSDTQLKDLATREQSLTTELAELESGRAQICSAVEESTLKKYERLLKFKGGNVVVGIEHGVCGGCHMKFPVQIVVSCQAEKELVTCPNCGRILYYTRDMDLAVID